MITEIEFNQVLHSFNTYRMLLLLPGRFLVCKCPSKLLATGRQPGTFSENAYGKSYTQISIVKAGVHGAGEGGLPLHLSPFKIQMFVWVFHMICPKKCPVAFQWPEITMEQLVEAYTKVLVTSGRKANAKHLQTSGAETFCKKMQRNSADNLKDNGANGEQKAMSEITMQQQGTRISYEH